MNGGHRAIRNTLCTAFKGQTAVPSYSIDQSCWDTFEQFLTQISTFHNGHSNRDMTPTTLMIRVVSHDIRARGTAWCKHWREPANGIQNLISTNLQNQLAVPWIKMEIVCRSTLRFHNTSTRCAPERSTMKSQAMLEGFLAVRISLHHTSESLPNHPWTQSRASEETLPHNNMVRPLGSVGKDLCGATRTQNLIQQVLRNSTINFMLAGKFNRMSKRPY